MSAKSIILRDLILRHNIPVSTRYGTAHVLVFYNPKDNLTWSWKTSTFPRFEVNKKYSIIACDEGDYNLSRVKEVDFDHGYDCDQDQDTVSEQDVINKIKLNALDILIPDTHLTNDEKYDMIGLRKGV